MRKLMGNLECIDDLRLKEEQLKEVIRAMRKYTQTLEQRVIELEAQVERLSTVTIDFKPTTRHSLEDLPPSDVRVWITGYGYTYKGWHEDGTWFFHPFWPETIYCVIEEWSYEGLSWVEIDKDDLE